ncbi:MAG: NADH-quinone oxidoreductase subunit L [Verrucomicrobiota bacterium]|nr:NADH-quinone oxidoreductase subunit L [Verrucomicrobiota bacterium]
MIQAALSLLFLPLLSAVVTLCFLRKHGNIAALLSVATSGGILAFSSYLIFGGEEGSLFAWSTSWFALSNFQLEFGFLVDSPAKTLLFVVSFVGLLIHIFSLGYMADDDAKARYFGGLSIFMFSMIGITLADNLIMIFVFWELVGFSSYLLIAHYFKTDEAAKASRKAFIVNRVGDFGFLLGIIFTYWNFGTVNLQELQVTANLDPSLTSTLLCLLLACGFIGKSAQFPLHVWLPDAMAGPTPVSALIHAATMVAAGIFLLIRIDFLFTAEALKLVGLMGAVMGLYAGFCALTQKDIKKVLAYSTLSQLGYMAAAFGLGIPGIALFHLMTHAFFKALMFLGSGSVIHACHHEQDIFAYGGLRKKMPITAYTFLIGVLAISGVHFLSGYFSKDAILLGAYNLDFVIFSILYLGAILTSLYMFRLYFLTFCGEARSKASATAHESTIFMTAPLIVLAFLSVVGGFVGIYPNQMVEFLKPDIARVADMPNHLWMNILGLIAWVGGLLAAWKIYGSLTSSDDPLAKKSPNLFHLSRSKLFFDEIYSFYVEKIQDPFFRFLEVMELLFISGIMVRGAAGVAALFALLGKSFYSGKIHSYSFWFIIGTVGFLAYSIFGGGNG